MDACKKPSNSWFQKVNLIKRRQWEYYGIHLKCQQRKMMLMAAKGQECDKD